MKQKSQREVWLIRAPYSDYSSSKVRPVIIISNNNYNKNSNDFIAVHITTNIDHQYAMKISNDDFTNGSLMDESIVRFDTITRYEGTLMIKRIGKIKPEYFSKIYEKIIKLISAKSD
jgi:mRNA interferase MazF